MNMSPLISLVVPSFNASATIGGCLASIAKQTFKSFDVVIVDGKSSDNTLDVVSRFDSVLGNGMTTISESDRGPYDAMNKGVSVARGKWLLFLGADDRLIDAEVLRDVSNAAQETAFDLIYGDVLLKSNGHRHGGPSSLERLLFQRNICHQAIFYHRSVFERLGGFDLRYPIWADWEFNIRCFRHPAIRTHWMDRIVTVYNDESGSSTVEDPIFRKELPVTIRADAIRQLQELRSKPSFRWGKRLFGWLDN